ncbi:PH domain-containing protein [Mucilaginibacter glaciei]|uniref:PH domain-containing protein n=1 Tax=Mucilaginibacter glaciei TaxID=2772109 RepID=A0A926RZY9_9SPHI|nr:PH domain-containing protein [Mucilaginibacter glaciei]MBD1391478.1 PH domain-containing protein [Mucilaginibacter glaciei]
MSNDLHIYRSKQGIISYLPILILAIVMAINIYTGKYLSGIIATAVISIVVLPMLLNTKYTITGDGKLYVRCGWIVNIEMDIQSIRKLEDTRSVLSSPALSLNRIEIFYNKFDSVMVSPKNKAEFVTELQRIKPSIEYRVSNKG